MLALCLAPLGWLAWRAWHHDLTANPIEYITHLTGDWTIRFIVITLTITPLRRLLRLPELIRFRRMLGLFAFFYGLFGGWDDHTLAELHKATALANFMRPMACFFGLPTPLHR